MMWLVLAGIALIFFLTWADHRWPNSVGYCAMIFVFTGFGLLLPFFLFSYWLEHRKDKRGNHR